MSLIHTDSAHGSGHRQIVRSLRQVLSNQRDSRGLNAVMECVDWYTIRNGYLDRDWLVMHTAGNPQHLDMRRLMPSKQGTAIAIPAHPRQLVAAMRRLPFHSGAKSTRMRLAHMRRMFRVSQNAGHSLYIATDLDVSGTYLASVLPGFRALAEAKKPLRVCLNETTVSGVRQAIQDAADFDWYNAEAGRLRDMMDYVIGSVLNYLLRHATDGKRRDPGFTVGRTRLLALDCLSRRWLEAGHSETRGSVFLVFPGVGGRAHIEQDIRDGSVLAVSAELRRGPYSRSGLLRELLCWEIGTVSTRYKLIASLLRQGLIHEHGPWLAPSRKGLIVEQHLLTLLEGPDFSLWDWQNRMTQFLATADERSDVPLPDLEQQVDAFLLEFLASFRNVLDSAGPTVQKLWKVLDALPPDRQAPERIERDDGHSSRLEHENADELGLEGAVPMGELARYVNTRGNLLSTKRRIRVFRIVPHAEWDWDGMLRRQLLIEREIVFRLVDSANIERLIEFRDVPCTLFRADCDPRKLSKALRRITGGKMKIDRPLPREMKAPAEDSPTAGAHPPLEIFDPCPADMRGPDAFLVATEYMRPYEHTLALLDAQESGQELLDSFQCGRLVFQRTEPFEFGTAHTFDKLLATMYDRYGMPFETTAQIAESLYLGGGAT